MKEEEEDEEAPRISFASVQSQRKLVQCDDEGVFSGGHQDVFLLFSTSRSSLSNILL